MRSELPRFSTRSVAAHGRVGHRRRAGRGGRVASWRGQARRRRRGGAAGGRRASPSSRRVRAPAPPCLPPADQSTTGPRHRPVGRPPARHGAPDREPARPAPRAGRPRPPCSRPRSSTPTGYGRIVRDGKGEVERIVETKDADGVPAGGARHPRDQPRHLRLRGADALRGRSTQVRRRERRALPHRRLPASSRQRSRIVTARPTTLDSATGVNDRADLMEVESSPSARILEEHARARSHLPRTRAPRASTRASRSASDTVDRAGREPARRHDVGGGCTIGPHTTVRRRRDRRRVQRGPLLSGRVSRSRTARTIGPFAYLRPGTVIGENAKIGTFVEVKNSNIGAGAKVPHLSYIGDADVGDARQPRRRHHHRQLRRPAQAPHEDRKGREDRRPHVVRRAGGRRGRGVHWRRLGDHRGCADGRPRSRAGEAEEHRGLRGPRGGGLAVSTLSRREAARGAGNSITAGYDKRLMVTAGRASQELGAKIADRLGVELTDAGLKTFADGEVYCRYEDSIRGADLFIVQSICGTEREGLTVNDALMELLLMIDAAARLGAPRHRRHPVVRLLAPGQEVRAARADLRPARGASARDRRHRPPADDGPPRRPAAGLLLQAGRPHDRDADPHPVRAGPARPTATS